MLKTCRTCKKDQPENAFSVASSGKKGNNFRLRKYKIKTQCKNCDAAYAKQWRKKHTNYVGSGKITKYGKDRLLMSAIGSRLIDARSRAKKKQQLINIDKDYLLILIKQQNMLCAISGMPLDIKANTLNSLSLDKIIPNKGYVQGNVQWLCWAVNRAKGELSTEDFINMCRVITVRCNDYPEKEYTQVGGSA